MSQIRVKSYENDELKKSTEELASLTGKSSQYTRLRKTIEDLEEKEDVLAKVSGLLAFFCCSWFSSAI